MPDDAHHYPLDPPPVTIAAQPRAGRGRGDDGGDGRKRWVGPAVASGLAMVAAAIAGLVLTGMQDNAIYSKPVDQLLAAKAKFVGRPVRAEGNLAHGSLVQRDQPLEEPFSVPKNRPRVPGSLRAVRGARHLPRRAGSR